MSEIFGNLDEISKTASFYLERTKIIQGNIANADTPFYKPKDLKFERVLTQQVPMKKTDEKHINPFPEKKMEFKIEELNNVSGYDANKVNIEHELAKMAESSIMYKSLVETMKKEISKIKYSISGR